MKPTSKKPITAFIVGAGAVEGAWDPILKALQPHHDFPLTPDGANAFLARLVYLLRWWSQSTSSIAASELKKHKKFLVQIRSDICKALKNAELKGKICVRPEFSEIVKERVLCHGDGMMLITTNWDNVVGKALNKLLSNRFVKFNSRPLHIHGSTKTPNLIYLPTEITQEPYRNEIEDMKIGSLHGSIYRGLEGCHRSVVYGLSISPLDAELGQTLAAGWSNPIIDEIEIIAPDHDVISHRINLLLDHRRDVKVKGYCPNDLDNYVNYSIVRHA